MVLPEQQLAQELSAFERGLHAKIIFEEIWKVEGASMVPIFPLLFLFFRSI
jgi:hypothetical protein